MALWPGLPRSAGTRKVTPILILLKQETVSGSGISRAICKSAPRSRQITMPAPHHSDAQTDRQTDRQTVWRSQDEQLTYSRLTNPSQAITDIHACKHTDRQTTKQTERCMTILGWTTDDCTVVVQYSTAAAFAGGGRRRCVVGEPDLVGKLVVEFGVGLERQRLPRHRLERLLHVQSLLGAGLKVRQVALAGAPLLGPLWHHLQRQDSCRYHAPCCPPVSEVEYMALHHQATY